ncbi:MAG TPA: hypothetical protein VHN73_06610, partial [Phenylobacterium sp.]|nr:hypothetical protein [Phenylobacterium sp.]
NLQTGTAADFATARTAANVAFAGAPTSNVAAYTVTGSGDAVVFIDTNGDHVADDAILLIGKAFGDVVLGSFI